MLQAKAPVDQIAMYLVWKTGVHGQRQTSCRSGPPHLAWSFNRNGEVKPGLVEARDRRMGLNTAAERSDRQEWVSGARPQGRVSALADAFPQATPVPGVRDNGDTATAPVPVVEIRRGAPASTGKSQ